MFLQWSAVLHITNNEYCFWTCSSPVATGVLVALDPLSKYQALSNWNVKQYKSVEFYQISNVKPPAQM